MATTKLAVTGMHCGACKMKVEKALKAVPGVYAVDVDLVHGEAQVDSDGRAGVDAMVQAVQSVGYAAKEAA